MFGLSSQKILNVPYYAQVSSVHCQSTVMKMYAQYLDRYKFPGRSAGNVEVQSIWNDINLPGNPDKRADKVRRNAHGNIKQWLEDRYNPLVLKWTYTSDPELGLGLIVQSIDMGYPVIAGVSHERVEGHIVLIVGYIADDLTTRMSNKSDMQSFDDYSSHRLVVHDPYGAFHPSLKSELYGKNRFVGGKSLSSGGESAPGKSVELGLYDVSRQRDAKPHTGHGSFNLMAPL